jgi:nucleotide-binding universal stress UspA family protein
MENILVPIDFYAASRSALHYAAELAVRQKRQLILLHACHPPVAATEVMAMVPDMSQIRKQFLSKLKAIATRLRTKYGNRLQVECYCTIGFAADDITFTASQEKTSLIVMGVNGENSDGINLFGSIARLIMKNAPCPVITVHAGTEFKKIKKILFAADLIEQEELLLIKKLALLAHDWKSQVMILHVNKNAEDETTFSEAYEALKIEKSLKGVPHSFHIATGANVTEAITEFAAMHAADMICMVARKHSIFKQILTKSNTKKMVFNSTMPLLTFNENFK